MQTDNFSSLSVEIVEPLLFSGGVRMVPWNSYADETVDDLVDIKIIDLTEICEEK